MYLSKRSNGIYHVFYEQLNGKLTSISTRTRLKSEALRLLTNFKTELKDIHALNGLQPIRLKDFIFEFLKVSESTHTGNTIATYKTSFNSFLKYTGNVSLMEITPKMVQKYFTYKVNKVSVYQARKDRINLGYAFNWAAKNGYLLDNPCSIVPRFKIPEKQPLFFSRAEFDSLIESIDSKDILDIVKFAVNTGLRQMELLTLTWEQVYLDNRMIILDNQRHLTKGKRVRAIPINETALDILKDRYQDRADSKGLVFTFSGNRMTQDFISKRFKKYVIFSKVNPKLNFHSLRHTFATWLIKKGAPIYEVSKLLGHADIKTTEIYSHINPEDLRGSINLLSDY